MCGWCLVMKLIACSLVVAGLWEPIVPCTATECLRATCNPAPPPPISRGWDCTGLYSVEMATCCAQNTFWQLNIAAALEKPPIYYKGSRIGVPLA